MKNDETSNGANRNLLEQNLEKETLIYDLAIDKAFNLNETLSIVYKACGQNVTFDELKDRHKFTDDFIYLALDELKRSNLLIGGYESPFAKTNRRVLIKKVGLATMFALPLITGIVAPRAVNAGSGADAQAGRVLGGACAANNVCYNNTASDGSGFTPTCQNGICCYISAQYNTGESFVEGGSDAPLLVYYPGGPPAGNACPSGPVYQCCTTRADCTCTYEPGQDADGNDIPGLYALERSCTCTA